MAASNQSGKRFPLYGWLGLLIIAFAEAALFVPGWPLELFWAKQWTTPLCWWGYIFAVDAFIYKQKGASLLHRPSELIDQTVLSVVFWIIFELYNLHMDNWTYTIYNPEVKYWIPLGATVHPIFSFVGAMLSFMAILPGILLSAELFQTLRLFHRFRAAPLVPDTRFFYGSVFFGLACVIVPLLFPTKISAYLGGLVWIGFVFLLEPFLYVSKAESLLKDLSEGKMDRIFSLFFGGFLCGFLWEFWNYWSWGKWTYTFPITSPVHIFEMPLPGFWGFGPFAWELFCMYQFSLLIIRRNQKSV